MLEFIAEAAVLVGLLSYARSSRDEDAPAGSEAQSERPSAERSARSEPPPRQGAARPAAGPRRTPPPPPPPEEVESEAPAWSTVLDDASDMAQKAWTRVSDWIGGAVQRVTDSAAPAEPPRDSGPAGQSGRQLWSSKSPFGAAPSVPRQAPASSGPASRPSAAPAPKAPPAGAERQSGASAASRPATGAAASSTPAEPAAARPADSAPRPSTGVPPVGPPALVRDPVCGLELPWARAVSLRIGGETHYFCGESCRARYAKRLNNDG